MPTPVFEDIAEQILARLKAGTYAEPYKPIEFVRPKYLGSDFQYDHLKCVVLQDTPQRNEDIDIPGNPPAVGWTVPYRVETFITPNETNPNALPLHTVANYVLADVIKVLTTPIDEWFTWNNRAPNTQYETAILQNESGSIVTAQVTLNVDCRHNENDPYTAR
jgi:hypothetical protein